MIAQGILEKTLEFTPGEWLLSSYIATGIENVLIFIKADNEKRDRKTPTKQQNKPLCSANTLEVFHERKNIEGRS